MRPNDVGRLAAIPLAFSCLLALSTTVTTGCKSRTERLEDDIYKTFAEIDLDQDGKLSRGEYTTSRLGRLGAENKVNFDRLDANNDDVISNDEMRGVIEARKQKPQKEQPKQQQPTK